MRGLLQSPPKYVSTESNRNCGVPSSLPRAPLDASEDATKKRQRRLMMKREQAERSRQRLEQKVKQNELQQQLAAKKDRYNRARNNPHAPS